MQGDLLELYDIEKALEGITSVIHCAGFVSMSRKDAIEGKSSMPGMSRFGKCCA